MCSWRLLILAGSLAALANLSSGWAAVPPSGRLDFSVIRNGDVIGHNVLSFESANDELRVSVRTRVAVRIAFVTVYHFDHDGEETWRDGRLVSLSSRTDDDGTKHQLTVRATGESLRVEGDRRVSEAPGDILPASLWAADVVKSRSLLNTLDGTQMAITVHEVGLERIAVQGREVEVRHYSVAGELQRELWYDAAGVLMQVRLKGKDGSDVLYALR